MYEEVMKHSENDAQAFARLQRVIEILRAPGGCPWDRAQTHETLTRGMVEEAYEVVQAIENHDRDNLVEELGDVLLQVIFHTIIGAEEGKFTFDDVTDRCTRKMLFRHSHVFGEDTAANAGEALENWEKRKTNEKGFDSLEQKLRDIPRNYPALYKAFKAASKIRKDAEARAAAGDAGCVGQNGAEIDVPDNEAELGALLYGIVRAAEAKGLNPETALRRYVDSEVIHEDR